MRLEPVERRQAEPLGDRARARRRRRRGRAARRRGSGRASAGGRNPSLIRSLPSTSAASSARSSRSQQPRSAAALCASAAGRATRRDTGCAIAASSQSLVADQRARHSSTRRPSAPTSLRTVLPSVGSPMPSWRCSASMLDESLGQRRPAPLARPRRRARAGRSASASKRRQHREPAVDRVGHLALDDTSAAARASPSRRVEQSGAAVSGSALIAGTGSAA